MTGEEIYEFANSIVGEEIPEVLFYNFLNAAKDRREELRPWQFLKKLDSSQSANPGDDSSTTKPLPEDFRLDYKMFVGDNQEYTPVPFEQQHLHRFTPSRYFVNIGDATFSLTGRVASTQQIFFYYIKTTPDIVKDSSPVWPARFHKILGFDVAAMYLGGVDFDDVNARMAPANKAEAQASWDAMISWDTNLKLRSMNNSYSGSNSPGTPLGMW